MIKVEILRNLLLRYGAELGLKSQEVWLLWHMLDHDFDGVGYSFPSELRLAARMGLKCDSTSKHGKAGMMKEVRKWIQRLEEKHLIHVTRRRGKPNRYRYYGLIKKLLPFHDAELGRTKKKLAKVDARQATLSFERGANAPHVRGDCPSQRGANAPPNSSMNSSMNSLTNERDNEFKDELKLGERDFKTAKDVVEFLRELVCNSSPEISTAASAVLLLLEELWNLKQQAEVVKSWRWFFYAAKTRPQSFNRAFSIMRQRVQSDRGKLNSPGAYFTKVYKSI